MNIQEQPNIVLMHVTNVLFPFFFKKKGGREDIAIKRCRRTIADRYDK